MNAADESDEDPREVLAEEVSAAVGEALPIADPVAEDAAAIVMEFTAFDTEALPDVPGFDRIVLKKEASWLPASGKSVKAGNLRLNLGKLFESAVSGVGVYFTAVSNPVFAVFTAIVALRSLVKAATVEIEERDAWILWAVWVTAGHGEAADEQGILRSLHEQGQRYGHAVEMSPDELRMRLGRLEKIRAIQSRSGEWEVIETLVVTT